MPENECGRLLARRRPTDTETIRVHLEDGPHEAGWLAVVQWRGVGQSSGEPDSFELTAVDAAGLPLGWWSFDSCEGAQADAISSFQLGPEPWEACDDHMAHCSGNPHVWS